jgi:hypothetical protein
MKRSELKLIIEEVIEEIKSSIDMGDQEIPDGFDLTYRVTGIDPASGKPFEGHYQSKEEAIVIKNHIKNGKITKVK